MVYADLTRALGDCWCDVSNAGGAVGFPYPPVTVEDVAPAVQEMIRSLHPELSRLLVATVDGELAGWLLLAGNRGPLFAHWATVKRVQTALPHRGRGIGAALMHEVARCAAEDLGLAHLHLSLRGGAGIEPFYARFGWREVGRWPGGLRLSRDDDRDDRDEVLMYLPLTGTS